MGRRISKEFLHPSILEGVNNKIGNLDSLETDAKGNMVQAINELVEKLDNSAEIENGKELIANAVGEPLTAEESFDEMSNDINGLLSQFKTNMMNNGITVESGDKFKQLIDKIATLTDEDIIKNTRVIHGTTIGKKVRLDNGYDDIIVEVHGLPFEPICGYIHNSGLDNGYFIIYEGLKVCSTENNADSLIIYEDGFRMPADTTASGRTYTYWVIGLGEDTTLRDSLADILEDEGVSVTEEDDMASLITKVDEEFDRKNANSGLDIISATELPSEVVNNQIVLISNIDPTAVEIKDNSLCNPSVEGMVNVGTTSTNNGKYCTIAKDNITVLLYLIRALQYVNGSVKQLSAYVGIDGSWVQFSWAGLYAFISGAYENSNLFGTFKSAPTSAKLYSAYPPEISGNTVKIGQTSSSRSYDDSGDYKGNALYYFSTKINCSNYSKLKVTITNYAKTNVESGYIHFGIMQSVTNDFSSSTDKFIEIKSTGTYEVDLSSYNKTGYIAFYIFSNSYSTTKSCSAYVYISSIELMP